MMHEGRIRITLPRIIACILVLAALCGTCMAATGSWSSTGPLTTGTGDKIVHALAVSPDGMTIFCGTGNGRVFSFTLSSAAVPPVAHFTSNVTSGTAPLSVQFNDTSNAASPLMWNWSLGNNNWINTTDIARRNISYTYPNVGDYDVSLTVTNASGSSTATQTRYIHVTAPSQPTASFTGTPLSGNAPLTVTFTDQSQVTAGTMWNWSFGDSTWTNTTTNAIQTHTYSSAGTYTVTLTVTNATGSDTRTRAGYISVTAPGTTSSGNGSDTSGEFGRDTSYAVTAPGTGPSGTMTFVVNEPLSAGSIGYSYAITSVSMVPAETLGSTDLLVTDGGSTSNAPNGRTLAGIVAISPVGVNPSAIRSGTIAFAVPSAWLSAHGLAPADIVMMRYHNGAWVELPTTYQYEAGGACSFVATTPGFSYFAIASRAGAAAANPSVTGIASPVLTAGAVPAVTPPATLTASVNAVSTMVSAPVTTETAAVPAGATGSPGFPVLVILAGIGGIVIVVAGAVLVRRWWIRRQNPALFMEYD